MLFNTRQSHGGHEPAERSFSSLEAWVRRKSGQIDHETRVAEIADALFNLTRDLHGLDTQDLLTLKSAALVHDVGRAIDPKNHPQVGAKLVLEDAALPLRALQRRWLAYLTLYHRGPVPALGEDRILTPEDGIRGCSSCSPCCGRPIHWTADRWNRRGWSYCDADSACGSGVSCGKIGPPRGRRSADPRSSASSNRRCPAGSWCRCRTMKTAPW